MFGYLLRVVLWPVTAPVEWGTKVVRFALTEAGLWEKSTGLESLPRRTIAGRVGRRRAPAAQ
eukprot:COSAG05_NODE_21487_length_271_cov_0.895349_1_plen_61_part_10